ncbi:TonB-dependent receptor plug domain-containing protein [Novosphingobium sediminicola]|uniref:Outer membrane receptor protein involved in Fe transport n=1 Tax=Novosphingobium sediminicola TaxID=563162 RepID=A0A7W6CCB3_9SPHN|nr:TonB-dependent receptor [Novosphingobium sediminicola]MBB3953954.1 outer membrane receptor protein involved in Fe transport [Novosphingobium sediminicola]
MPTMAGAQTSGPASTETAATQPSASEEKAGDQAIIVTGTRIQGGFNAPTPVTVASVEDLKQAAPTNIADGLNQLPAFNSSTRTTSPGTAAATGNNGQNLLNLRGLGPNRTLILLNGNRMVATNFLGSVDVNILPQALIKRVDVVTGGASAAYGSDAVSGVVNFVLDENLNGLKGEIRGGLSTYGDMGSKAASLAYGKSFIDDRLHILASAEYFQQDGIRADQSTGRAWFDKAAGQYAVPGAATTVSVVPDIRSSAGAYGGLITAGALKGITFLPNGQLGTFNYGTLTSSTFQSGGDGPRLNIGFSPSQERYNMFLRAAFDVTDKIQIFAEGLHAYSHTNQGAFVNSETGSANQFTIFRDNAYLPGALATLMDANHLTAVTVGRYSPDFPLVEIESVGKIYRGAIGAKADLGHDWKFDTTFNYGRSVQNLFENNLTINRNLYAAADAVRDSSGNIVCRSTLSGLDVGCKPLNIFGVGSPGADAIRYVTGNSQKFLTMEQYVASANISGKLGERFSLGAGPISVATGVEYRKETAVQTTDALSPITTSTAGLRGAPSSQNNRPGGFNFFNPLPFTGSYTVKEGYLELGIPVLKDSPVGKSLSLSTAARYAYYSRTGGVTTWKLGAEYEPVDGIRLRAVRSRDIRGASILELFNPSTQSSNTQLYQGRNIQNLTISLGNPDLVPEKADTTTFGVVLRPAFIPGLQISVDRYVIKIKDAIGALTAQQTIDGCAAGSSFLCSQLTLTTAGTLITRTPSLNLAVQQVSGIDFEAAYNRRIGPGTLTLRALATNRTSAYIILNGSAPISSLGETTTPRWTGNLSVRYATDKWSLFVQEQYISPSLFDATKVEGVDTNLNHTPAILYTNATFTYNLGLGGAKQQLFLSVNNLFNQDPPIATRNPTTFSSPTTGAYDSIGRYFTAGVRFQF